MTIPKGVKVLGFRALVQLERMSAEGVVIPEAVTPDKTEGVVVAVGEPKLIAHGQGTTLLPVPVKVSDRVWVSGFGAPPREFNGCVNEETGEPELYLLVSCEDIFCILPDKSRIIVPEATLRGINP